MKHAASQFLYGYWNEIRAARRAPKRFEIEPGRIGAILSETFILERSDDRRFVFRLTGTRITDRFQADLRSVGFEDIWSPDDQGLVIAHLSDVADHGGVARFECQVQDDTGRLATVEYVLLPLVHTRNRIDRAVGVMAILSDTYPSWLGNSAIVDQKITEHETLWPDGEPRPADTNSEQEPALAPHVRTARIVRADRRQFRVYEGGRKS